MVMPQDVLNVSWSRTFSFPHCLACFHRRAGGQKLKTWATTIKADLEPISGPRVFGQARWRKDWVKVSSELTQDRRAWSTSVRDVVNAAGDAGSTRPGSMPTQVQDLNPCRALVGHSYCSSHRTGESDNARVNVTGSCVYNANQCV